MPIRPPGNGEDDASGLKVTMLNLTTTENLLAQAEQPAAPAKDAPAGGDSGGWMGMLPAMVAIAFIWYFMLLRPQKREQNKREQLLKELKKNDRVVTIGGIIGSIANVTPDGKEVTLKVDDNTRLRMLRSSIQTVLKDEGEGDAPKT